MTIQRYLLVVILSVIVLATFSAALQGFKASNIKLNEVFDEEMPSIAYALKNSLIQSSGEQVDTHSSFAFQIWRNDALVVKSKNAPADKITTKSSGFGNKSFLGAHWRYYILSDDNTQVIVAQPVSKRLESIEEVLLEAILPIVYAIPVIGCLVFFAIRKSLAPVRELSQQVQQKSSSDLSPIHITANSMELIPVETTINDLLNRLESAFEREQNLASNAAHELRTPISVLKLNAHNIKIAYDKTGIQKYHMEALAENTARMAHVIEQVIALNRTTPENFDAKKERFNIVVVLQDVIAKNFEEMELRQQSVSLEGAATEVQADRFSIETLFDNLVKNAIKYSGEGSEILVTVTKEAHGIKCTVEDSGPGIDEENISKAFQRFYRVKQHKQTGSGLGLSIVSHIVDLHNGNVTLERSALGGLKVTIVLPSIEEGRSI